jgi:Ca2+-transporting ATPase
VIRNEETKDWKIIGDPTEAAVLICSEKLGFKKGDLENEFKKIKEIPFDHKKKYRISLHKQNENFFISAAGAPESIIKICTHIFEEEKEKVFTAEKQEEIKKIFYEMSARGLRVVALAEKKMTDEKNPEQHMEQKLTFLGLFGILDDIRKEVPDAVRAVEAAGIRVIMITGDFWLTAETIARKAGIMKKKDKVLTGNEIELLQDVELKDVVIGVSVFARVTPE